MFNNKKYNFFNKKGDFMSVEKNLFNEKTFEYDKDFKKGLL